MFILSIPLISIFQIFPSSPLSFGQFFMASLLLFSVNRILIFCFLSFFPNAYYNLPCFSYSAILYIFYFVFSVAIFSSALLNWLHIILFSRLKILSYFIYASFLLLIKCSMDHYSRFLFLFYSFTSSLMHTYTI